METCHREPDLHPGNKQLHRLLESFLESDHLQVAQCRCLPISTQAPSMVISRFMHNILGTFLHTCNKVSWQVTKLRGLQMHMRKWDKDQQVALVLAQTWALHILQRMQCNTVATPATILEITHLTTVEFPWYSNNNNNKPNHLQRQRRKFFKLPRQMGKVLQMNYKKSKKRKLQKVKLRPQQLLLLHREKESCRPRHHLQCQPQRQNQLQWL
mmetsp:Transcript_9964/g.18893  ORF Transcript_9964/g.18893 Transcript_9964/m.18893 type:complete len:212 (+) Transcript_9964:331-966(+)